MMSSNKYATGSNRIVKSWIFGMVGITLLLPPLVPRAWTPCSFSEPDTACPISRSENQDIHGNQPEKPEKDFSTVPPKGQPTLAPPLALFRTSYGQVIEIDVEVEQIGAEVEPTGNR